MRCIYQIYCIILCVLSLNRMILPATSNPETASPEPSIASGNNSAAFRNFQQAMRFLSHWGITRFHIVYNNNTQPPFNNEAVQVFANIPPERVQQYIVAIYNIQPRFAERLVTSAMEIAGISEPTPRPSKAGNHNNTLEKQDSASNTENASNATIENGSVYTDYIYTGITMLVCGVILGDTIYRSWPAIYNTLHQTYKIYQNVPKQASYYHINNPYNKKQLFTLYQPSNQELV